MRIGLVAALARTPDGELRAQVPFAGQTALAWQIALLRAMQAERIICLCDDASPDILGLQHAIEADGGSFHALRGFTALPALVRAEDELIVLRDGLIPEPALVGTLPEKGVLCLPADHPVALAHPIDFERIDAARHWAGVLVMRGAPVQQLADFPADADATSVLLRLALQSGTPCRDLAADTVTPQRWLLAESTGAVRATEMALLAGVAPRSDWRAPVAALAALAVRKAMPRGLGQGARIGALAALGLLAAGLLLAVFGMAATGFAVAAAGAFAAQISLGFSQINARLLHGTGKPAHPSPLPIATDAFAALTAWFALSPWPDVAPLAICGPLTIGLARLVERDRSDWPGRLASDRAALLLVLALAAAFGAVPLAIALLSVGLLAALLLNRRAD
jgi:hypothetical protein